MYNHVRFKNLEDLPSVLFSFLLTINDPPCFTKEVQSLLKKVSIEILISCKQLLIITKHR